MNGDVCADHTIHLVNKWLREMNPSKDSHAVPKIEAQITPGEFCA
jgi:hypothetical protein